MTAEGFWPETWEPGNRLGCVTSVASVLFLAVFFWWFGVVDTGTNLATISAVELAVAIIIGLLLGGGALVIHAKPDWRERWRTSMRLRAVVSAPIVVSVAVLHVLSPPVVSLGFVVMAITFVPGRVSLYRAA